MERNVADRLLVTGCKLFEVAVVEMEGCKWTETSHAAAKWQFRGRGRSTWEKEEGRGGEIRGSEKGCEGRKGKRRKKREGGV